jgi:hypothetical protein
VAQLSVPVTSRSLQTLYYTKPTCVAVWCRQEFNSVYYFYNYNDPTAGCGCNWMSHISPFWHKAAFGVAIISSTVFNNPWAGVQWGSVEVFIWFVCVITFLLLRYFKAYIIPGIFKLPLRFWLYYLYFAFLRKIKKIQNTWHCSVQSFPMHFLLNSVFVCVCVCARARAHARACACSSHALVLNEVYIYMPEYLFVYMCECVMYALNKCILHMTKKYHTFLHHVCSIQGSIVNIVFNNNLLVLCSNMVCDASSCEIVMITSAWRFHHAWAIY